MHLVHNVLLGRCMHASLANTLPRHECVEISIACIPCLQHGFHALQTAAKEVEHKVRMRVGLLLHSC